MTKQPRNQVREGAYDRALTLMRELTNPPEDSRGYESDAGEQRSLRRGAFEMLRAVFEPEVAHEIVTLSKRG